LDLFICKNTQGLDIDIYRKPNSSDTTILFASNEPMEQKLAAYRYLMNRMHSLPLNTEDKHKEWNTILHIAKTNGFPYSSVSKLNVQITQTISLPPSHNSTPSNYQKWFTFTYHNSMKRKITDPFKNTNIQITYHTNNAIYSIFKTSSNNTSTYIHSGIYQLQCHTCHLSCIGQTGFDI